MVYVFQNYDKTKEITINSQDYPDAYLYINRGGCLSFELLNREKLEEGAFHYPYNDYVVSVKSDTITIWCQMAHFDSFVEDIQDYFCK